MFANSEMETCWESCIIHFPTIPPCSTRVDVLETDNVPIIILTSSNEQFGNDYRNGSERRQITCPVLGLYSSPAEYSTLGHIVLDLTSVAYQPKSRERSAHQRRHETFAQSVQKSAYPALTRELDEDEDDKPLVRPDRASVSEDEDDKPLEQSTSKTELITEMRESAAERSIPTPLRRRNKTSHFGETHLPHWNKMCQETRVSDQQKSRHWAEIQMVKLFATS